MSLPFDDSTLDELAKTNPDLVAQYRAKMQGPNAALKTARDTQDYGDVANTLGKGLNDLGNANKPKDAILYNRMDQLGKAPTVREAPDRGYDDKAIGAITGRGVAQAKEDQSTVANTFNEEQKLIDTGRGRDWQDKAHGQQQKEWTREDANNDPNSPESNAAREYLKKISPTSASIAGFDKMTAAQAMKVAPGLLDSEKLRETVAQRRDTAAARQAEVNQRDLDRKERTDAAATTKASAAQDKNFKDTTSMLESARGSPAVAQAEKDIYAASKATSLAKMYGDPDKMSSRQVNTLASEVGKIAQGGSPSMHELEGLTPNTLVGKFGRAAELLTNEPSPAHAAAFVKEYMDYANAVTKDAQGVISDKYGRVIESRKGLHSDDQNAQLQKQYTERFEPKEAGGLHGKDLP